MRLSLDSPTVIRIQRTQLGSLPGALDFNGAVVVAVLSMRVVEVVTNEIVNVSAVRDLLVSATGPVDMVGRVPDAGMLWRAAIRVSAADLDGGTVEVLAPRPQAGEQAA